MTFVGSALQNEPALRQRRAAQQRVRNDGAELDVSALPSFGFGHRSVLWWATVGLMAIESTVFALAIVAYFYLRSQSTLWPPTEAPPLWRWGTLNTLVLLVSLLPNWWTKQRAETLDRRGVRIGLVLCMLSSLVFLAVRALEFGALNCRWDGSAYGSIVWMLLGLHTLHLITDSWDSGVLTVLAFTGPFELKRCVDVSENALYWYFVVFSWLPIYAVIYAAPRAW
jgi:heme/copper-type cytochrome/quinol oxidase subunit 3